MSLSRLGDWLASTTVAGILGASSSLAVDFDILLRRALIFSKLFTKNWGKPETFRELVKHKQDVMSQRRVEQCIKSMKVDMIIEKENVAQGTRMLEGRFRSPHAIIYPNQLPGCLQWARWRAYLPNLPRKGVCIHLAGTGDHSYIRYDGSKTVSHLLLNVLPNKFARFRDVSLLGQHTSHPFMILGVHMFDLGLCKNNERFYRRELGFARGLLEEGIGSILLQNPFYADRKPPSQFRSSLENVSDLFVMGAALISECNYLISWAASEGYGPMALSGVSMGGFMASLAATNVGKPICVVPCMSWTTAAPTFTEGALRDAINYEQLQRQLEDQIYLNKLRSIPNVDWVDEMYERNKENGLGLAHNMMCILMNEFTSLANYPVPVDTSLCTAIIAENDAYILRPNGSLDFRQIWPGMRVLKMERMGHVTAYLRGHHLFRETIAKTLRQMEATK